MFSKKKKKNCDNGKKTTQQSTGKGPRKGSPPSRAQAKIPWREETKIINDLNIQEFSGIQNKGTVIYQTGKNWNGIVVKCKMWCEQMKTFTWLLGGYIDTTLWKKTLWHRIIKLMHLYYDPVLIKALKAAIDLRKYPSTFQQCDSKQQNNLPK